ncbi:hypothetical protein FRC17_010623, partial [Serendipita sp. 399]
MASPTISSPLSSVSSTPLDDLVPSDSAQEPQPQQQQQQQQRQEENKVLSSTQDVPSHSSHLAQQRASSNNKKKGGASGGGDDEEEQQPVVQLHHLQLQWHQEQLQREQLLTSAITSTNNHNASISVATTTTTSSSSSTTSNNGDNVGTSDQNGAPVHGSGLTANASSSAGPLSQMPTNRFIPYHCPPHNPCKGRYITSNDPRGYIPVYEYPLNGQWIMMDMDDGYILWTGIWKALGNHKADIVKMLESQPELANQLRRVRGGYLKIQGTWLAYEVALRLARRVAWPIRHDLVPLFGPTFPTTCLAPDQPGYGTVIPPTGRRKPRRSLQSVGIPPPHTAPYPPKLPLAKEYAGLPIRSGDVHHQQHNPYRPIPPPPPHLSTSPIDNNTNGSSSSPFAHPTVPSVPALVPVTGVVHSPQELTASSSQYNWSPATYSPLHEGPMKHRYSPYVFPRRHHSPSISAYGGLSTSPSSYEGGRPHTLVHHSSAPNLRAYHHHHPHHPHPGRAHMLIPRLGLGATPPQHLPAMEINRSLHSISAGSVGPEYPMETAEEYARVQHPPQEGLGVTSSDSAPSANPTTNQFNELAPIHEAAWHSHPPHQQQQQQQQSLPPQNVEVGGHWPETPVGEHGQVYDQGTPYHQYESTPTFTEPSTSSPRTAWSSYDAYGRQSPPEQHLHYPGLATGATGASSRPGHHYHSSVSSMSSFHPGYPGHDRRFSMADSLASSFPEPEMG